MSWWFSFNQVSFIYAQIERENYGRKENLQKKHFAIFLKYMYVNNI